MKQNTKTKFRDFIINVNPFSSRKKGKRILCFHDIQDQLNFEKRIKWLLENFEIHPLHRLLDKEIKSGLAITFDDGYQSWITNVAPVLERYQIPATFFVNSGLIDLEGKAMQQYFKEKCLRNPKGLQALSRSGFQYLAHHPLFEIGGHTKDHFLFSKFTATEKAILQIETDKEALEKSANIKLRYFAYPFGQSIHAPLPIQRLVQKAGYSNAFTIIPGFIDSKTPYTIHRDSLELFQSDRTWYNWLHGSYDQIVEIKNQFYKVFNVSYR